MKYGNVFWGVLLILTGGLFVLKNIDVVDFSWLAFLRLWPLLLVLWGISVLPVKAGIRIVLSLLAMIAAVLILLQNPDPHLRIFKWHNWDDRFRTERFDDDNEDWKEQHFSENFEPEIETVNLSLDIAAVDFETRGKTDQLFRFDHEGKVGRYKLITSIDENGNQKDIDIYLQKVIKSGKFSGSSTLRLHPDPVWNLNLDVGASKIDLDLRPFKTERIDIDGGAASIELKVGDLVPVSYINIDAAVSSIEIKVPESAACEVKTSTVLSSRDISGFNKIKKGLYQTPNFSDTIPQIFISVEAAVSGLEIDRY
ncbi:MAG: DUF5668 domain-containing protein [Bacteroidales bacterium]|nr:DUF5668 domain-containing protein [Bacteroidales bacterium]